MTVAQLEHTMPARELDQWVEYWSEEPWGAVRDNLHAGIVASAVLSTVARKNKKVPKPSDFLLRSQRQIRQASTARSLAMLRAMAQPRKKEP